MQKSMDLILEGIDTGNTLLIEAATNEFKAAYEALSASVEDFAKVIGEAGLDGLKDPYTALVADLGKVGEKLNHAADKFSYADQMKMLKEPSDKPEALLTVIAMNHDTNVNAVKDAVIAIAEWLEGAGKGIFTIGSQGIQLDSKFKSCLKSNTPFNLSMFAMAGKDDGTKNALIHNLVGVEYGAVSSDEDEGIEESLKDGWKAFYNPDGKEGDEESNRFEAFKETMFGLASGAEEAWKAAGKAIQDGKPSPEFQKQAEGFGSGLKNFMGSLFKSSKSDGKIDAKLVMGEKPDDPKGLMALEFGKLGTLVGQLIEMSQTATDVAEQAGEAVDAQQEATKPPEEVEDFKLKLADAFDESKDKLDSPDSETMQALETLQDIIGSPPDAKNIKNVENLKDKLEKELNDEAKVQSILKALGMGDDSGEDGEEGIGFDPMKIAIGSLKDLMSDKMGSGEGAPFNSKDKNMLNRALAKMDMVMLEAYEAGKTKDEFIQDLIQTLEELQPSDAGVNKNQESKWNENKKKLIKKLSDDTRIQAITDFIQSELKYQLAERAKTRWGVLAGIIKG